MTEHLGKARKSVTHKTSTKHHITETKDWGRRAGRGDGTGEGREVLFKSPTKGTWSLCCSFGEDPCSSENSPAHHTTGESHAEP